MSDYDTGYFNHLKDSEGILSLRIDDLSDDVAESIDEDTDFFISPLSRLLAQALIIDAADFDAELRQCLSSPITNSIRVRPLLFKILPILSIHRAVWEELKGLICPQAQSSI